MIIYGECPLKVDSIWLLRLRIYKLYLPAPRYREVTPPQEEVSWIWHSTASDGEATVLKVWGVWSTPSFLLLPDPHCPGVVVHVRVWSMGQIDLWKFFILDKNILIPYTVCKLFVLRIVTWSYNCLLRIIIIRYVKPYNCEIKLVGFCGILTIVGYLMPNPLYRCILNIYDFVLWHINHCRLFNAKSSL